jgi:hypothetical protein
MAKRLHSGSSAEVARGRLRGRVPDLVGSRLPRPYQFPARIQSFQAVAAPFPGDATAKLLFDGCGVSIAVKTITFRITLNFLPPWGCRGVRRVTPGGPGSLKRHRETLAHICVFPKGNREKIDAGVSEKFPPRARRPKPPSRAASAAVVMPGLEQA